MRVEALTRWPRELADRPRLRIVIYAILGLVLAVLTFFPQPYVARAKLVPQDTSTTAASTTSLLGALGGSANSIGSLLTGGRPSNDLYLIIARSDSVSENVIETLKLVGEGRKFDSMEDAKLWLDRNVEIHLLLGGAMEVQTKLHDPQLAVRVTSAYEDAISRQLAGFGRQLIINKKRLVQRRFADASERVAEAEAKLAQFRRQNSLPEPSQQFGAKLTQRAALEAQIQAQQVELAAMREYRGPESIELQRAETQLEVLRQQLARMEQPSQSLSVVSTRYLTLFRDYQFDQAIYAVYQRSAEQVAVEELAAQSASYIQIIDGAHLDADRKFNIPAVALLGLLVVLAIFVEWYGPATGLFTRKGLRHPTRDQSEQTVQ